MSTFSVPVVTISAIEPIPNADAIELAVVGDYRSVVKKGDFTPGDLGVYIPEAAIIPPELLKSIGLEGKLTGREKNRVKAIKLRGCLSQGILLKLKYDAASRQWGGPGDEYYVENPATGDIKRIDTDAVGYDCAEFLGIVKWEPPIPAYMAGDLYNAGLDITVNFDVENFKRYPDIIQDGEEVVFTEKLHGSFCGIGLLPESHRDDNHYRGRAVIFSKGLGHQGVCFKPSDVSLGNVYYRATRQILDQMIDTLTTDQPVFILGEVFGKGVQDLQYGTKDIEFRAFDVCVGYRGNLTYLDYDKMKDFVQVLGVQTVPLLYRGPFSKDLLKTHTRGKETVSGTESNIREGLVAKPVIERRVPEIGRVMLKSVSEDYLLRGGDATEYN